MSRFTFGFLGCGNMGGALALAASKALNNGQLAVCDALASKTEFLTKSGKAVFADADTLTRESRYIFLAVKPQGLSSLFEQIRPVLKSREDRFIIVSMAAGVSISDIEKLADIPCPVIRMMPNTPVQVEKGMIVYTANALATQSDLDGYLSGLAFAGNLDKIPEKMIDAAGALSGCGPAFVYLFAEALADAGVECGLPRDKAQLYAAQTLLGSADMLLKTGRNPGELKDAVCSPAGTTIAGVHALENGSFRGTVMNAVDAAYKKTSKLK